MLFIEYPKCSTCKRAKKFLDENEVEYVQRHIVEDTPTKEELQAFAKLGKLETKKLFNTSGIKYRELNLKDRLKDMNEEEKFELLSTDGMLIKRPLLIGDDFVLVGFKEDQWKKALSL